MSRKHYELIASALRAQMDASTEQTRGTIEQVARELAARLAGENLRFNQGTFLRACGVR